MGNRDVKDHEAQTKRLEELGGYGNGSTFKRTRTRISGFCGQTERTKTSEETNMSNRQVDRR
jgi:hypothetical protein